MRNFVILDRISNRWERPMQPNSRFLGGTGLALVAAGMTFGIVDAEERRIWPEVQAGSGPVAAASIQKIQQVSKSGEERPLETENLGKSAANGQNLREIKPSVIEAPRDPFTNATFPTVIHVGDRLAIAVPSHVLGAGGSTTLVTRDLRASGTAIRSVALLMVAGRNVGKAYWQEAKGGRADFSGLSEGAYDVYHLTTPVPADQDSPAPLLRDKTPVRRVLLERNRTAWREDLPWEFETALAADFKLTSHRSSGPTSSIRMSDLKISGEDADIRALVDRGLELLAKDCNFAALRQFVDAVGILRDRSARPWMRCGDVASSELFNNPQPFVSAMRRQRIEPEAFASALAESLALEAISGALMRGLARTYEKIWRESETGLDGAEHLAELCYRTARRIHPGDWQNTNDLAVLLYARGDLVGAESILKQCIRQSGSPTAIYNLGRVLEKSGRMDESLQCIAWACKADKPEPAALSTRLATLFSSHASAFYEDDFKALLANLETHRRQLGAESPSGRRVMGLITQLQPLVREFEWNTGSLKSASIATDAPVSRGASALPTGREDNQQFKSGKRDLIDRPASPWQLPMPATSDLLRSTDLPTECGHPGKTDE